MVGMITLRAIFESMHKSVQTILFSLTSVICLSLSNKLLFLYLSFKFDDVEEAITTEFMFFIASIFAGAILGIWIYCRGRQLKELLIISLYVWLLEISLVAVMATTINSIEQRSFIYSGFFYAFPILAFDYGLYKLSEVFICVVFISLIVKPLTKRQ